MSTGFYAFTGLYEPKVACIKHNQQQNHTMDHWDQQFQTSLYMTDFKAFKDYACFKPWDWLIRT